LPDRYARFSELAAHEIEGVDFAVANEERDSLVAVIAPHGGHIEPHTTEIARAIAGTEYSFYAFDGLRAGRPHRDLHITSHKFDEPRCLGLIAFCDIVVAVHGRRDGDDKKSTWVGGNDRNLRAAIAHALSKNNFPTIHENLSLPGEDCHNICNRGRRDQGVQLEIPRSLRDELDATPNLLRRYVEAIRSTLSND
jgi:phage replication-related protein YjqB (UPF0714/DUF867 family)